MSLLFWNCWKIIKDTFTYIWYPCKYIVLYKADFTIVLEVFHSCHTIYMFCTSLKLYEKLQSHGNLRPFPCCIFFHTKCYHIWVRFSLASTKPVKYSFKKINGVLNNSELCSNILLDCADVCSFYLFLSGWMERNQTWCQ